MFLKIRKSITLHYTRSITPKHVTRGGVHLRGLTPGQHSFEETSREAVGGHWVRFDRSRNPTQTLAPIAMSQTTSQAAGLCWDTTDYDLSFSFQEVLAEKLRRQQTRSTLHNCQLFFFRIFTWALYLALTGGSMALIYFLNKDFLNTLQVLWPHITVFWSLLFRNKLILIGNAWQHWRRKGPWLSR